MRKLEKRGIWKTHTVGPGIWQKTEKNVKKNHTVGPGLWRETLKNMENEKCTL